MKKLYLLLLVVSTMFFSSCGGGVYIKAPVVCQLTGAKAVFGKRMPKDSPYSRKLVRGISDFLNGETKDLEESLKMITVMYIIDVTDMANAGMGKLSGVKKSERDKKHFWSPVSNFTISLKTGAYSVAGLSEPLIPAIIEPVDGRYNWERIGYEFWRKAALDWFNRMAVLEEE